MEQLKEFEIWIGRYTATGEDDPPHFVGKSMGKTFEEALKNYRYPEDIPNPNWKYSDNGRHSHYGPEFFVRKGDKLHLDLKKDGSLTYGFPSTYGTAYYDHNPEPNDKKC